MQSHSGKKLQISERERLKKLSNFKNYLHIHSGGRQFKCDLCNKNFLLRSHLKIHMKSHAFVRPYFCSLCGKGFKWLGSLKWHQKICICAKLILIV